LQNPLQGFFDRYHLEPFSEKETKNFINKPLQRIKSLIRVDEEASKKLFMLTLGHPFFLSFILSNLLMIANKENIKNITKSFVITYFPTIFDHLSSEKFNEEFERASDNEKDILIKLAQIDSDAVSPKELKTKQAPKYLKILTEKKSLLIKTKRGLYRFYHPLFKEHVKTL